MKTNVTTKIKDIKFGAKEDVITLTIDGNITDEQVSILRTIKKTGVAFVSFSSSQVDIDDVDREDLREGIRGSISGDGIVSVDRESDDPNQLTIDETEVDDGEEDDEELAELSMEELDEEDRLDDRHEDNDGPMIPDDDELPY
jgi:hypothetical protein